MINRQDQWDEIEKQQKLLEWLFEWTGSKPASTWIAAEITFGITLPTALDRYYNTVLAKKPPEPEEKK